MYRVKMFLATSRQKGDTKSAPGARWAAARSPFAAPFPAECFVISRLFAPLFLGLLLPPPAGAQQFDFYTRGPYRPAVPRPEAITGYAAGEQQTMYAVLQNYLDTLMRSAPGRVRVERWGETFEHRPIRALIISDPANLARLDQIRADVAELTDPRKTTAAPPAHIAANAPAIVLFQYP